MADGIQTLSPWGDEHLLPSSGVTSGTIIGERYRIEDRIAEGGMATVFLASDLRHDRKVAVKVLHESLAHTIGVQRFLREIEVVARLQHPHLLTLIDSGTVGGFPYYVMPYVEAQSLRETIAEHGRLSLDEAVRITREIADGLAYAHERGVVHRDIKPSNILMSDGHAMVVDFGIATAIRKSAIGRVTMTGTSLGSPTYMSPEQAAGESDVDARSDVYSLACVLFEMLTGQPPIDSSSLQQIVTQKLTGGHARLRERRPDLPESLDAAIERALSPDRTLRFASVDEFSNAITASLPQPTAVSTRTRWIFAAAAAVILVAGAVIVQHQRRVVWATQQVAEIDRLVRNGQRNPAFQLANRVLSIVPNDTTLKYLRPTFTDFLNIVTVPSGATVSIRRLGDSDTTWRSVGTTPIAGLPMPKILSEMGYQMRIQHAGFETVDILASVFTDLSPFGGSRAIDTLYLDPVGQPTAGMARIRGFTITSGKNRIRAADYYIGKHEVTNAEYKRFVDAGGYGNQEYWTEPMVRDGKPVSWTDGVAALRDQSGRPGPSTWSGGTFPSGRENYPVSGVSWYEAAAYARFAKMQLPTERHWFVAATRNNREVLWMYAPWSNMNSSAVRPVAQGRMSAWGLYDVAGNVREWCVNPIGTGRLTYGGAWEDSPFNITHRIERNAFDRSPDLGFRVARYNDPDSVVAFLARPLVRSTPTDFSKRVAVSNEAFEGFRRIFDYDRHPLDTKLESEGQTATMRWQKVSFTASYSGPRMAAYLLFPRNVSGPFEPVIYWGGSDAIAVRRFNPNDPILDTYLGSIPRSGRVLVVPLLMGTYERDDSTFSITQSVADTTIAFRDLRVQWIKDLRRTVDFLETRKDIRADRLGYYGLSWGGDNAPLALAMEPRIKAAVLYSAGYNANPVRAEVDPVNYTPRVHTPTLMLNGKYDVVFPYETSQKPFFDQLGTPAKDKNMVMSETGHILPLDVGIKAGLAWFDKYLTHGEPEPLRDK